MKKEKMTQFCECVINEGFSRQIKIVRWACRVKEKRARSKDGGVSEEGVAISVQDFYLQTRIMAGC